MPSEQQDSKLQDRNAFAAFAGQLAQLAAGCNEYGQLQAEICTLLGAYAQAAVLLDEAVPGYLEAYQILDMPVFGSLRLILHRPDLPFTEEDRILAQICLPVMVLLERRQQEEQEELHRRQIGTVKAALNTLSYSELAVVVSIFRELGAQEGILVAGKVADGIGVNRSMVASALRKLESASIIETRSLGVKGTFIKILNPLWVDELRKMQ